jgi:CRP/FNR family transcriptional regulator
MEMRDRRTDARTARLRGLRLCADLDEEALRTLANCEFVRFAAGRTLCVQGETGRRMYLIVSGHADVYKYAPGADRSLYLTRRGPGELVGELSLLDGRPQMAEVVAAEECLLLPLDREAFLRVIAQAPQFALNVMASLADKIREAAVRLERFQAPDPAGRVALALLEVIEASRKEDHTFPESGFEIHITQQEIADRIAMRRETVANAIAALRDFGALRADDKNRRRITVASMERLRGAARRQAGEI